MVQFEVRSRVKYWHMYMGLPILRARSVTEVIAQAENKELYFRVESWLNKRLVTGNVYDFAVSAPCHICTVNQPIIGPECIDWSNACDRPFRVASKK